MGKSTTTVDYETVIRKNIKFPSTKGELNLYQLWEVPLRSTDGFNLDAIAQAADAAMETAASKKSFVDVATANVNRNPEQVRHALVLDVVKHVIEVKVSEQEALKERADKKKARDTLLALREKKQNEAMDELSIKEIDKQLAALDDDSN